MEKDEMKEQNRAGSIYLAGIAIWKIWLAEAKAESKKHH